MAREGCVMDSTDEVSGLALRSASPSRSIRYVEHCYGEKQNPQGSDRLLLHFFLLQLLPPNTPLLLAFQLIVEQEESFLIRLRRTDDGEHALAGLVVRFFGDGDLGA